MIKTSVFVLSASSTFLAALAGGGEFHYAMSDDGWLDLRALLVPTGKAYTQQNNTIRGNIVYRTCDGLKIEGDWAGAKGNVVEDNVFVAKHGMPSTGSSVDSKERLRLRGNRFYSDESLLAEMKPGNSVAPYGTAASTERWPDPNRTLKRYVDEVLGLVLLDWEDDPFLDPAARNARENTGECYDPNGLKTFMAVATNMRRGGARAVPSAGKPSWTGDYAWDERFTGRAVVNWIRAGFGRPPTDRVESVRSSKRTDNAALAFSTTRGAGEHRTVAVDPQGSIYVCGAASSANWPATPGAFDTTHNSPGTWPDIGVTKFSPEGKVVWATLIGGPNEEFAYVSAVNAKGELTIGGRAGEGFPTTPGAFDRKCNGGRLMSGIHSATDGFVLKLSKDGDRLLYSTYIGGAGNASMNAVWNAITQIDRMRQLCFKNIPSFRPEAGFEAQFDVKCGDRTFPHTWKVTDVFGTNCGLALSPFRGPKCLP